MRTPFEPMIHDNDGNGWEGQLVLSRSNDDMAHQTCEVWSSTWIGTQSSVLNSEEEIVSNEFALHQNYPNPFNPETKIQFDVAEKSHVSVEIFNLVGQKVATLANSTMEVGKYTITWNGMNDKGAPLPSGMYFYEMNSSSYHAIKKLVLVK